MKLPVVAIIGRPNVGKSTLVNRIAGDQQAIVFDQPGITRDRTYQPAFWCDRDFQIVDTGGLVFNDDSEFLPLIREQALIALAEASVAIFVVDGQGRNYRRRSRNCRLVTTAKCPDTFCRQ
ncbi:MAG UNVERIFIED_CONTAM: 50S ribosome-binding GTPase [Microcystis novacekii LVE1205-3]|jgi:GTP-binding protein